MPSLFDTMRQSESYERLPLQDYHLIVRRDADSGNVDFRELIRNDFSASAHYHRSDGWKIHLSISPQDMKRAWDKVIAPILTEAKVGAVKFVDPATDILPDFTKPNGSQAGKMVAVYGTGNNSWADIAKKLEIGLAQEGIRPGPSEIPGDRMVTGSRYIGYRNERNFGQQGNGTGYISSEHIAGLVHQKVVNPGWEHNPFHRPDSLQNINFSNDREVLAARGAIRSSEKSNIGAQPQRTAHHWESHYPSSAYGQSMRYTEGFETHQAANTVRNTLAQSGINVRLGENSGKWYMYVPMHDQASVAALEKIHGTSNIGTSPAAEMSLFDRAKALFGIKPSAPFTHENALRGKGLAGGAAMAITAGAGALLAGARPAEAAAVVGEAAISAIPGVSGRLAHNADEARIRDQTDAFGAALMVAGGVIGAPGGPVGAVALGAVGNLAGTMGGDEVLRLYARYVDGKKETVAPSAGEQLVTNGIALASAAVTSLVSPSASVKLAVAEAKESEHKALLSVGNATNASTASLPPR